MKLIRFCSEKEYQDFVSGKVLVNTTDHYHGGKGGSISRGFCFSLDSPRQTWRYLKGCIPPPDVCMILDIPSDRLTESRGRYADFNYNPPRVCYKTEYCTTKYSNRTARLIETLRPADFSTPDEMAAASLIYSMMHHSEYPSNLTQTINQ